MPIQTVVRSRDVRLGTEHKIVCIVRSELASDLSNTGKLSALCVFGSALPVLGRDKIRWCVRLRQSRNGNRLFAVVRDVRIWTRDLVISRRRVR